MWQKISLIFLLTYISQAKSESLKETNDLQNIIEDANALMEKLKKIVQEAVTAAVQKLKDLLKEFTDFTKDLSEASMPKIKDAITKLMNEFEALKDKAAHAHIDITDCLIGQQEKILNLPVDVNKGINKCVEKALKDATRVIKEAIDAVNNSYNIVKKLQLKLEKCSINFATPLCISKVVAEISLQIIQLPIKIAEHVAAAVKLVGTLKIKAKTCVALEITNIPVKGALIIASVADCVNNKIINH